MAVNPSRPDSCTRRPWTPIERRRRFLGNSPKLSVKPSVFNEIFGRFAQISDSGAGNTKSRRALFGGKPEAPAIIWPVAGPSGGSHAAGSLMAMYQVLPETSLTLPRRSQ
jgi:hypothetical protein